MTGVRDQVRVARPTIEKGSIEIIDDDPKHYAFSNIFEVASSARPWEKVAVGKNMEYVLEVIRAEGTSEWRTRRHDEFALVLDGEVTIELVKLDEPAVPADKNGSVALGGDPVGRPMGRIVCRQGHMALLPANAAYRMQRRAPLGRPAPDHPRRRHHRALGRDLPVVKR